MHKPGIDNTCLVSILLAAEGLESLKEAYVDGTKIEANANRYTFAWGNAIKTQKETMVKQIDELWQFAQFVTGFGWIAVVYKLKKKAA